MVINSSSMQSKVVHNMLIDIEDMFYIKRAIILHLNALRSVRHTYIDTSPITECLDSEISTYDRLRLMFDNDKFISCHEVHSDSPSR